MMSALYKQEGAMMEVEILKDEKVLDFIDTHASILDSTFEKVKMSDSMRSSLQQSNWVFSGMKTFHELKEAFPSLLDENGEKKPFERFYNDVQRVDETYNRNYLRAEYNFVSTSAEMAARWEEFEKDGDRYFLQYRTVGDDRVRKEHMALDATTLPVEHPFWDTHYPPNGWNCFIAGTPILTAQGWKPIETISKGELVVGGSGQYRVVIGIHAKPFQGKLVRISTKRGITTCTENHRFLTADGWVAAGQLQFGDILIQVGKNTLFGKFTNIVNNTFVLALYGLMTMVRKGKAIAPLAVNNQIEGGNNKINNVSSPTQLPAQKGQTALRQIGGKLFFGLCNWKAECAHTFRMLLSRLQRISQSALLNRGAQKGGGLFKLFRNPANKFAVLFRLALADMAAFKRHTMIYLSKALSRFTTTTRVVYPLSGDSLATMANGNTKISKNTHDRSIVQVPIGAQPARAVLFIKIAKYCGITNIHLFDGFNSFYRFVTRTFFHTQYVLVWGKDTKKATNKVVYNLSIATDESYIIPAGIVHNCRCNVVQVRKSRYPATSEDELIERKKALAEEQARHKGKSEMFRFNPGKQRKTFPDYNPYTIKRCGDCDLAKGKMSMAILPDNEVCMGCRLIRSINRSQNKAEFNRLKNNPDYKDVAYDEKSGGVKATHVSHNFDHKKGDYEKVVQNVGFLSGHSVILEEERHDLYKQRNAEGSWDGVPFEIAGREEGTPQNVRNGLKHCASKPNVRVAVLYFPNNNFDIENFHKGLALFTGLKGTTQYKKFSFIYCIQGDEIVQIKKPS